MDRHLDGRSWMNLEGGSQSQLRGLPCAKGGCFFLNTWGGGKVDLSESVFPGWNGM